MNGFSTVMAAINPILLLIVGWFLNSQIDTSKSAIEKLTAETRAIDLKGRVDKGTFIKSFVEELSGDNDRRRKLALQAIVVVMPEDAPRFLEIIASFDPKKAAAQNGKDSPSANAKDDDAFRNAKKDAQTAQDLLN